MPNLSCNTLVANERYVARRHKQRSLLRFDTKTHQTAILHYQADGEGYEMDAYTMHSLVTRILLKVKVK